jgi:two-component system, NtrC family, sensor kinase
MTPRMPTRILIVDDNPDIHADFSKILSRPASTTALDNLERLALDHSFACAERHLGYYELEFASQGEEALAYVQAAVRTNEPFALAFVDMRMPPGWDGLQTTERLWAADPRLQVVICSAYSDYDWDDVLVRLNQPDNLLIVKKPFDAIEILQSANALTGKWHIERELREQVRLRRAAELELGLAQKLEAVGRLAAGVAHEINTPIQYVGDSIHFIDSAFGDLLSLVNGAGGASATNPNIDLHFLGEEVPRAIARVMEGTQRVAAIVRAMKDFAYPDATEKRLADLNRAIDATLLIARNEYKYVATMDFQGGDIPEFCCNVGELSQVFLNFIVNAAHALSDAGRDTQTGRITIRTRLVDKWIELQFEDNGCGIPAELLGRIFDPFFTTKGVGRGSGQGLAIARSIVVDKHAGRIDVSSTPNVGTRFIVRLPV